MAMADKKPDFTEAIWKMDKWAYDDFEMQADFYEVMDDETLSFDEKVEEIEAMLDIMVQSEEKLDSYMHGPWTYRELAVALVEQNT